MIDLNTESNRDHIGDEIRCRENTPKEKRAGQCPPESIEQRLVVELEQLDADRECAG